MVFANKTYGVATPADRFAQATKKRPVLYFGLPFVLTVVIGSFALSELTATKYNVHDNRTKAVNICSSFLLFFPCSTDKPKVLTTIISCPLYRCPRRKD